MDVRFEVRESDFDFYIQTIFRSTNAREVYRDGRNGVHCTGGPVRKGGKLEQGQVQGPGGAAHGGPGNGKEEGRNFIGTLGTQRYKLHNNQISPQVKRLKLSLLDVVVVVVVGNQMKLEQQ